MGGALLIKVTEAGLQIATALPLQSSELELDSCCLCFNIAAELKQDMPKGYSQKR